MAATTNIVNLDALIKRADLAAPGEAAEDIPALSITGLTKKGFLYPALRKPDFQRETANWSPEQVADLIITFARRELIPAVILWRAGQNVFVIDGAHRLSALIAWVHDDYGDRVVSREFFQNMIPEEQEKAGQRTRQIVEDAVGSWEDHAIAVEYPKRAHRTDVAERAARIAWMEIPAQWIRNADHDKAEGAFIRINQGGTKIDPTEQRIIKARGSATALSARAIIRGGTGHNYWGKFDKPVQERIEDLGREIHKLLFFPRLDLPIRTLDVPVAGQGYGPHVLPFIFDLVNLVNEVAIPDSSRKKIKDETLAIDSDGSETVHYLTNVRATLYRICSIHASSLGLHPALYFYTLSGVFQPAALLSIVALFKDFDTPEFLEFTKIRAAFEELLMDHRGITEAIRQLGSGSRSRPRVLSLYRMMIEEFKAGNDAKAVVAKLSAMPDFAFLFAEEPTGLFDDLPKGKRFSRDTKGAAYLRDALPTAPRCATCQGLLHKNGMQAGHKKHRREGGTGHVSNAMMQHPFCNSTVEN